MIDIMKIAGKIGIMFQNKILTKESFNGLPPHLFTVAVNYQGFLGERDDSRRETEPTRESMKKLYDATYALIKDHMQPKNSSKLTSIFEYLMSEEHLDSLGRDDALEAHRITLQTHIARLMDP